jgi:hypothetical protein
MSRFLIVLLHGGYWVVYFVLVVLLMISLTLNEGQLQFPGLVEMVIRSHFTIILFLPAVLSFYLFYGLVFPQFFVKRRWLGFAGSGLMSILGPALVTAFLLSAIFGSDFMFQDGLGSFFGELIIFSALATVHGTLGLVIRGFIQGYTDIRHTEELNRKNYEMELDLIDARLNPHFLFNTINNIDVLIGQDPEKASAYLNKLSEILRFMLYEGKTGEVDISKELRHIENYLEIQKLRSANPYFVRYQFEWQTDVFLLQPMLFLPFIENAFKHSEAVKKENAISIHFLIRKDKVEFTCRNRFSPSRVPVMETGGLGNSLIRKRLELLYPQRHLLKQWVENGEYCVTLTVLAE